MPMLTPTDVHIDVALTNLVVAYFQTNSNFVADKIFPTIPVQKQTGKYWVVPTGNFNRVGESKVLAPRTRPERVGMSLSQDSYFVEPRALAADLDFQTLANADDQLNLRALKIRQVTELQMIDRENAWVDAYFKPGVWATDLQGVATGPTANQFVKWSNYTSSNPITDIVEAKRKARLASGGRTMDVAVMTEDVFFKLINHPEILKRITGGATVSNPALVQTNLLAQVLGLRAVYVLDTIGNFAKEGLPDDQRYLATNKFALFHTPVQAGMQVPAAGYTFTWSSLENSSGLGVDIASYTGDFLRIEGIAEEMHSIMAYDFKVIGNQMGIFFNEPL